MYGLTTMRMAKCIFVYLISFMEKEFALMMPSQRACEVFKRTYN